MMKMFCNVNNFQVKTQQGVPGQPSNFRVIETRATSVKLGWQPPAHSGENIISYELYWNDTFSKRVNNIVCSDFFAQKNKCLLQSIKLMPLI